MTKINDLNVVDSLLPADKLVVWRGSTQAVTARRLAEYVATIVPDLETAATYAELTAISEANRATGDLVYVAARTIPGDGGEGWWRFDALASDAANGGTILAPDAGFGRWLRQHSGAVNVRWFGAVGDGVADDTAAIQAALDAADGVYIPAGTYRVSSTVLISRNNILEGGGSENTVILHDAGITGVQVVQGGVGTQFSKNAATIQNLSVEAAGPNALNIGISLDNPTVGSGINNTTLRSVSVIGAQNPGDPLSSYTGTGIFLEFALKCVFDDVTVTNCGIGVLAVEEPSLGISGRSNANWWNGCKIRSNNIGMDVKVDDVYIAGCTIEANSTGILLREGKLSVSSTHFENQSGNRRQIHILGGNICSTGNFYSGSGADRDIFFDTTAAAVLSTSTGDTLNSGVKNSGTARVLVVQPTIAFSASGTGRVALLTETGLSELVQLNNYNVNFDGANLYNFPRPIRNLSGTLNLGGAGDGVEFNMGGLRRALIRTDGSIVPQNAVSRIHAGAGSPEGIVTAPVGSIYLRNDGGAGTSLYVKETGVGNTGWVAK